MPKGVFSQLQGGDFTVGQSLVAHAGIKAVGFTGSLGGGRALFDIATRRAEPIPFYGELGSNNPVFLLPDVMSAKAAAIGEAWAQSLVMGVGQFCTNPGVIVTLAGSESDAFKAKAIETLKEVAPQAMLTSRIAKCYHDITTQLAQNSDLECLLAEQSNDNIFFATPGVFQVDAKTWLSNSALSEEIFGPGAIIVECVDMNEMINVAQQFCGQLTATLHMQDSDNGIAAQLVNILEEKAGRVLVNGFPTGVEVCHSMVHGGPYPASTSASTTSVGSLAIQRFVRPVSYQNMPDAILPAALQNKNPLSIHRLLDGQLSDQEI